MICRSCRDAGDLASSFKNVSIDTSLIRDGVVLRIKDLHSRCRGGGWCDCQHNSPLGSVTSAFQPTKGK